MSAQCTTSGRRDGPNRRAYRPYRRRYRPCEPGPAGDAGRLGAQLRQGNASGNTDFGNCEPDAAASARNRRPGGRDYSERGRGSYTRQRADLRGTAGRARGTPGRDPGTAGRSGTIRPRCPGSTGTGRSTAGLRLRHSTDRYRGLAAGHPPTPTLVGHGKFRAGASLSGPKLPGRANGRPFDAAARTTRVAVGSGNSGRRGHRHRSGRRRRIGQRDRAGPPAAPRLLGRAPTTQTGLGSGRSAGRNHCADNRSRKRLDPTWHPAPCCGHTVAPRTSPRRYRNAARRSHHGRWLHPNPPCPRRG